jgi:hypothetical protein
VLVVVALLSAPQIPNRHLPAPKLFGASWFNLAYLGLFYLGTLCLNPDVLGIPPTIENQRPD